MPKPAKILSDQAKIDRRNAYRREHYQKNIEHFREYGRSVMCPRHQEAFLTRAREKYEKIKLEKIKLEKTGEKIFYELHNFI